ncbi:MAG: site-specific integrase, partial [Alphaproteobacteria bacterium]|nr:site-specific integrase [Alphaproteobacteria bacterium]
LYRQDKGIAIEPSRATLGEYLDGWLADTAPRTVAPKALERYHGLIENQVRPHLGAIVLQKLRPADIDAWLQILGKTNLSVRSIRHAHGVLRTALNHAVAVELIERNVCAAIKPPVITRKEIESLAGDQISDALEKLAGHSIYPIAALALGTGARRGEITALRWADVDLDGATVRIERSIEETKEGLRVKATKTAAGRRTVSLPAFTVAALREHRRKTLELRLKLGSGPIPSEHAVFGSLDGEPLAPYVISNRWRRAVQSRKLPKVTFHALRHSHASAIISAGLDVVAVSRRLGHANPTITLGVYAHLFTNKDADAAKAMDAALEGAS